MQKALSTKEINYIRDLLSWELLQAKKCRHYAEQAQGEDKQMFHRLGSQHCQNYEQLLGYVKGNEGGMIH